MKRCVIDLPIFRVSKPGADVDTAGPQDLLFHESFLFTQPYFFTFVACPFASNTKYEYKEATVNVTVPDVTDDPIVILYPVSSASSTVFPAFRDTGLGTDMSGYDVDATFFEYRVVSSTQVNVRFENWSKKAALGAYMVLMRRPV